MRAVFYAIERKALSLRQAQLIRNLEKALAEVKTLSGLLPMCARCKKIHTDSGQWQRVEEFIAKRTDAELAHGLCPDCTKDLYPGTESEKK